MSDPDATADGDAAATPPSSDAGPTPAVAGAPPLPPSPVRRRRRIWPALLVVLALIVVARLDRRPRFGQLLRDHAGGRHAGRPVHRGAAQPTTTRLTGKILLTDVFVTQLNALNYLQYKYFDSNSEVVSGSDLLGPTPNENQYLDQGYLQMAQAQSFATAAALSHLGYTVDVDQRRRRSSTGSRRLAGRQDAARGPGDHRGQRHRHPDRLRPDRRAARDRARDHRVARCRGILHQRRRDVRVGADGAEVGDAGRAARRALVDTGCGAPFTPTAYLGLIEPRRSRTGTSPFR